MSDGHKMIRFIDSEYRELFQIPDGAKVNIIYPPGDGRGTATRACKYLDDSHFMTLGPGSETYHIRQWAEIMERIGARCEPEVQLRDAEVVPFAPGEEKYCAYNREEGNTCAGHIAGDFGRQGDRFQSGWYNHRTKSEADWGGVTPEFQSGLHSAIYALRQGLLKDHGAMLTFCQSHPEAKLPDRGGLEHYGFKLDAGDRQYFLLCCAEQYSRDSRFVIYAYDPPSPVIEQAQPAMEKPSVLKQIRDVQNAPKPPRVEKAPGKHKGDMDL
jgi:hypothetical protein